MPPWSLAYIIATASQLVCLVCLSHFWWVSVPLKWKSLGLILLCSFKVEYKPTCFSWLGLLLLLGTYYYCLHHSCYCSHTDFIIDPWICQLSSYIWASHQLLHFYFGNLLEIIRVGFPPTVFFHSLYKQHFIPKLFPDPLLVWPLPTSLLLALSFLPFFFLHSTYSYLRH